MRDMSTMTELGQRLRARRVACRLSAGELAEAAGVARRTIYNAEHGGSIRVDTLIAIATALGTRADLLLRPRAG